MAQHVRQSFFFAVIASSIDEAFNDDVQVDAPVKTEAATPVEDDAPADADEEVASEEGTRENPLPLGSTISSDDWEVTLNSVDLNATDAVLAENPLNDGLEEGNGYLTANVTATYLGDDPEGETPAGVRVEYVSASGNSFDTAASMVIVPEYFNRSEALYEGASTAGNFGVEVAMKDVENGQILLSPSIFGDGVFFEIQ